MIFDVMIIDDDLNVRERLKHIIAWDTLPIQLSCEAEDSDSATELFSIYRPKIVITDINIPIISGLELAKTLQKEDSEVRFIVITGYNDFSFVKETVNLQAIDLLSKPIQPDEINKSLQTAVDSIKTELEKKTSFTALKELVDINLPQMQEAYMANLLRKAPDSPELVPGKLSELKISLSGSYLINVVITLRIPSDRSEQHDSIILLIKKELTEILSKYQHSFFSFTDSHFRLNCVIGTDDSSLDCILEDVLLSVRENIRCVHGAYMYAGIGPLVHKASDLYISHSGAVSALTYHALLEEDPIANFKNLERLETPLQKPDPIFSKLRKLFRAGDRNGISSAISEHITALSYQPNSDKVIRTFLYEYITAITNEALNMGLTIEQMEDCATSILHLFQKANTTDCLADISTLTHNLIQRIQSQKETNSSLLISCAKEYISQNIQNPLLDLERVSNHIGISRIYFCKLFHQVEGISFSTYLKNERLNLAKKLLRTTNLKVFEISDACGFATAKYFSYAFKQSVGQIPLEYRKNNASNKENYL